MTSTTRFEAMCWIAISAPFGLAASACSVEGPDAIEETATQTPQALSNSGGYAGRYNRPGQGHANVCAKLKNGSAALRYPDFSPTGYTLTESDLKYGENGECPDGKLRLDAREILSTPDGRLLFHRGGYGYTNGSDVKYGSIWIGDLATHVEITPSKAKNGRSCAAATSGPNEGHYEIAPKPIEGEMHYCKTGSSCDSPETTNGYASYGDPAAQGNADPSIHYTYLDWSWINVQGGGVVRSLLAPGDVFHRCDVPSIKLASVTESGQKNGWVEAIYGKTRQGGNWIYGWTVHSHRYLDGPVVYHVTKRDDLY